MISDGVLKSQYVRRILERDSKFITTAQKQEVNANYKVVTGRLLTSLSSPAITIQVNNGGAFMVLNYLTYIRFLDLKERRKNNSSKGIYNRILWGRLYNETLRDLRFGYDKEIEKNIYNNLKSASNG